MNLILVCCLTSLSSTLSLFSSNYFTKIKLKKAIHTENTPGNTKYSYWKLYHYSKDYEDSQNLNMNYAFHNPLELEIGTNSIDRFNSIQMIYEDDILDNDEEGSEDTEEDEEEIIIPENFNEYVIDDEESLLEISPEDIKSQSELLFEEDEDGDDEGSSSSSSEKVSYKKRLLSALSEGKKSMLTSSASVISKPKQTWEERYEDDPLRADSPTKEFVKPPRAFDYNYIAFSSTISPSSLSLRDQCWIPHLQWARRSALSPTNSDSFKSEVLVTEEFTRLSDDMMRPISQILLLEANKTESVSNLLSSEPLAKMKCVHQWNIYKALTFDEDTNLTVPYRSPYTFIGEFPPKLKKSAKVLVPDLIEFYRSSGRVCQLSVLFNADTPINLPLKAGTGSSQESVVGEDDLSNFDVDKIDYSKAWGIFLIFNGKSMSEATKFISSDPICSKYPEFADDYLAKGNPFQQTETKKSSSSLSSSPVFHNGISSVNIQDVNGLNHVMPRTFGDKTQLDQIHFMDPEDMFLDNLIFDLPEFLEIKEQAKQNQKFLEQLKQENISYRYNRMSLKDKVDNDISDEDISIYNIETSKFQRVRLQSVVDDTDLPIDGIGEEETSDISSDHDEDES